MIDVLVDVLCFIWLGLIISTSIYGIKWIKMEKDNKKIKNKIFRLFSKKNNIINDNEKEKSKKIFLKLLIIQFVIIIAIGIIAPTESEDINKKLDDNTIQDSNQYDDEKIEEEKVLTEEEKEEQFKEKIQNNLSKLTTNGENKNISSSKIPEYTNSPYIVINDNIPYFTENDLSTTSYEIYSNLDSKGRCGVAVANIGKDLMPTEERVSIGSVKPTGWHTVKYNGIDGNYLYNRSHLIGYQLTGENANNKNLITGTRYLNVKGMLPFENMVADYIKETNNHVLYRVTPIFEGDNLLASGVLMEAKSVEDNGKGILFNVYCYNVQPGIEINYADGNSSGPEYNGNISTTTNNSSNSDNVSSNTSETISSQTNNTYLQNDITSTFILNTNTKKYHNPNCRTIKQMSDKNKQEFTGTEEQLIQQGYSACQICH